MKKTLLLITSIITLFLVGCGSSSDKVMKCSLDTNLGDYSLKTEYEVHHDGKYVKSIKTVETVTSSDSSLIDQMETYMKSMYETLSSTYGGYDYKVSKTGDKVISNVTVDYTKINLKKLVEDDETAKEFVEGDKVTIEGIKKTYKNLGITCN